jgi:hypothetical protein
LPPFSYLIVLKGGDLKKLYMSKKSLGIAKNIPGIHEYSIKPLGDVEII